MRVSFHNTLLICHLEAQVKCILKVSEHYKCIHVGARELDRTFRQITFDNFDISVLMEMC